MFQDVVNLIKGAVGNNRENFPEDILAVKEGLSDAGYFDFGKAPEPHGYITKAMDDGIRDFQRDRGLRVDGYLRPGGQTEREIFGLDPVPAPRDEGGRIGFGGNVSGTLEPGKGVVRERHPLAWQSDRMEKDGGAVTLEKRQPAGPLNKDVILRRAKEEQMAQSAPAGGQGQDTLKDESWKPRFVQGENGETIPIPGRKPLDFKISQPKHTIDTFLPRIIGDEGTKYTDGKTASNAIDPYGASKMGIASKTLIEYRDEKTKKGEKLPASFTTDPKKVTSELARQVYDEHYYKRYNIDKISDETLAGHVLDSTINPSPGHTARWLQESLNNHLDEKIEVDGAIGPQTRRAIEKAKEKGVLREVNNELARRRAEYYKERADENPTQRGFLEGWIERAESYTLPPIPKRKPF